jgi:AcrR family transcriptional regulator
LIEVGYGELTMGAVAKRAGTTKPTLYRRWPSKFHLIHEVAFPNEGMEFAPETGDLAQDWRDLVNGAVTMLTDPIARVALPGLLVDMSSNPSLVASAVDRFAERTGTVMHERLSAYAAAGLIRPGVDPVTLIEIIGGAVLLAMLIRPGAPLEDEWVERVADTILRGLTG